MKSISTCSGDLEIRRSSCVSVSIFLGIEIQDHQFERADALTLRLGLLQSEDALRIEDISGRQATGNLDRHVPIMVQYSG